jgi:two-component system sensor histidine kinase BaeS
VSAHWRGTLTTRIALLGIAVAVLTGVVAGVLAVSLIRTADQRSARNTLARLADAAQVSADRGPADPAAEARIRRSLRAIAVRFGELEPDGTVSSGAPLARDALRPDDVARLLAHRPVSASRTVDGRGVLIAVLIGVAAAAILGYLVARRLARPLRRTAQAARELAGGRRDVSVTPEGPAEVADVTNAINTLTGALRQSEDRQRQFLLSVSHDLRTPVTAVIGYAESLADGVTPPERAREAGAVVLGEARRLERLVGDLLDLARLGARDVRVEFVDADLAEIVRGTAQVWSARCAAVGVPFRTQLPDGAIAVCTDPGRLRQVLDGLLENALRVTPAGAPIVLAANLEPGGGSLVEVRDAGPGLTDEDLAVAFEQGALYHRYRGIRQVGTGLGLAIVHELVTRLGGWVHAGHAAEGGARFTVHLPPAGHG